MDLKTILKTKYRGILIGLFVVLIYYWAISGTDTSIINFFTGFKFMADFVGRMIPPDVSNLGRFISKALETLQMAIVGSTIGALVAFPLSFLAARNVTPNKFI